MKGKRILLIGHNGYLGSFLFDFLLLNGFNVYRWGDKHINHKPHYVINCAGLVGVKECEDNPPRSFHSNYLLEDNLLAAYPNAKHIYFSSYYVYDYEGLCTEQSPTTSKYFYMKHKLDAEKSVLKNDGLVFRLGKLYGHIDIHKKKGLLESVLLDKDVVVDKVYFNPCSLMQVCRAVEFEIETGRLSGIFNLANTEICTHAMFASMACHYAGLSKAINIIDKRTDMFDNYGKFHMDVSKLNKYICLNDWGRDLKNYIGELDDSLFIR